MRLMTGSDLDDVIFATPRTDKRILLGDFNARVGTGHQIREGVIGQICVGKRNGNGLLLPRKCAKNYHLITDIVCQSSLVSVSIGSCIDFLFDFLCS